VILEEEEEGEEAEEEEARIAGRVRKSGRLFIQCTQKGRNPEVEIKLDIISIRHFLSFLVHARSLKIYLLPLSGFVYLCLSVRM
jgi:hypothetical protein